MCVCNVRVLRGACKFSEPRSLTMSSKNIEKFKILVFLRISCSTSSSFSRRNLCLSVDGSSVVSIALYLARSRWRRAFVCFAALYRLLIPPASSSDQAFAAPRAAKAGSTFSCRPLRRQAGAGVRRPGSRILRSVRRTWRADLGSVVSRY